MRTKLTLLILMAAALAHPCKIPVFDYAKSHWEPDKFPLAVFFRGSLTPQEEALVKRMESCNDIDSVFALYRVALGEKVPELWEKAAKIMEKEELPAVAMLYPSDVGVPGKLAFTSRLEEGVEGVLFESSLIDSIKYAYDENAPNFWIVARFGLEAEDGEMIRNFLSCKSQAEEELTREVKKLVDQGAIYATYRGMNTSSPHFRLDLDEPANLLLRTYLENLFPALFERKKSFLLPVYGKGRALGFIEERDLTYANILKSIMFLIKPCSCLLKSGNPGFDLPLPINWHRYIRARGTALEVGSYGQTYQSTETSRDSVPVTKESWPISRLSITVIAVLLAGVSGMVLASWVMILRTRRRGRQ